MTTAAYDRERDAFGRMVQVLVEIDLDRCTRTYGTAPCTAADLGDGRRCWYTFPTCQDAANYAKGSRTLRYCLNDVPWPDPAYAVRPMLEKYVQAESQRIDASKLVTYPEKLVLTFLDDEAPPPPDHDKGSGKYNTARTGSYWRTLRARNPNYAGRKVRILRGFYAPGMVYADFAQVGPEYVLKQMQFENGRCRITVESPLANMQDRQFPWSTSSKNVLTADAGSGDSTLHVTSAAEFPDPTSLTRNNVYAKCEEEIVRVTSRDTVANTLTVTRGQAGTFAAAHTALNVDGTSRNLAVSCVGIIGVDNGASNPTGKLVSDAMLDLLEWAGVASGSVDASSFATLTAQFWATPEILFILERPQRIASLMAKIREPRGILLYLSDSGKFTAKVMAPGINLPTLSDADFVADGGTRIRMDEDDEARITRASMMYDPSREGASSGDEYLRSVTYINADLEDSRYYGDQKEALFTDAGLDPDLLPIRVANLCRRLITRRRAGVRTFTGQLDLKKATLAIGDAVLISTSLCQGIDGASEPRPCIVTARSAVTRSRYEYEFTDTNFGSRYLRVAPDTATRSYDSASDTERQQYGYWGDSNNRVGAQKLIGYVVW